MFMEDRIERLEARLQATLERIERRLEAKIEAVDARVDVLSDSLFRHRLKASDPFSITSGIANHIFWLLITCVLVGTLAYGFSTI
jgi:hypothetical protein